MSTGGCPVASGANNCVDYDTKNLVFIDIDHVALASWICVQRDFPSKLLCSAEVSDSPSSSP
jgi:hypothetical protein